MAETFRIEIPVEVMNQTDMSALQQLESMLNKIHSSMQRNKTAADGMFNATSSGASRAETALEGMGNAVQDAAQEYEEAGNAAQEAGNEQERAAEDAGQAAEKLGDSVDEVGDAFDESGRSAKEAGHQSGTAFNQAGTNVDKFTQRVEKSNQSLRKMFKEKLSLVLSAIDRATPTLRAIKNDVKNLTAKAWRVAVKMVDFVTAPFRKLKSMIMSPITMTLALTGVSLGASSFVSTFSDFTAGMSTVKALSGATAEEFEQLTTKAEELGATTKFTATEASEGMKYLAMAGWEANDIINAMPGLLDLAAAGGTSLGTAADIVSDVMTAMGMASTEASRAADIFAKTATGTNTTIENLGESLKYAAPAAHAFGLSLSEAATITGMMANAGIKGSMAGTALRSSLLEMASPSKAASEAMKKLNLSFADSNGKMKDMKTIIKDLNRAFSGLSEQQRLQYAEDLFGTRGSSAWLAVIEQGAEAYEKLYESIDESEGAAKKMAETQLDNLSGDVTLLRSAVDGMKISVMKELDPYLRKGVQWLTGKIPVITEWLGGMFKKGIEKGTEFVNFLKGVFNSADFQNADGFAGKFFVAWDKIIAEPFQDWWENGGNRIITDAAARIGKGMGDLYHGIISGIFAALKGEEIDFEGLNLTGIGKAGAEAAKAFIDAFKESFDLGGLFNEAPDLLKAGVIGYGALKLGGGAMKIVDYVGKLKIAFGGVAPVAAKAGAAITATGTGTTAAAAGAGKLAVALGGVKAGLAAIPVWGWVALAVIAAVAAGIAIYKKAEEAHERYLFDTGKKTATLIQEYKDTTDEIHDILASMEEMKEIEIKLKENKGGNKQVIAEVQAEMKEILDRTVYITAALAGDTLTKDQVEAYQKELELLKGKEAIVKAKLEKEGYDYATVQLIMDQYDSIKEGQKEIALILTDKTELTPLEIQGYVDKLAALQEAKAEKELFIRGAGLTPEQIEEHKKKLDEIETKEADLNIKLGQGQGSMSKSEWDKLVSDYNALTVQAKTIEIMLKGAEANESEVNKAKTDLETLKREAEGILLKLAYNPDSDFTQEDLETIQAILSNMSAEQYVAQVGLENVGAAKEEIQELIDKQNELYRAMVESSGGYYTQRDIEQGRITQSEYNWWMKDQIEKKEIARQQKRAEIYHSIQQDARNVPELVAKRDSEAATMKEANKRVETVMRQRGTFEKWRNEAANIYADYDNGRINVDEWQERTLALRERMIKNAPIWAGMDEYSVDPTVITSGYDDPWWDKMEKLYREHIDQYETDYETAQGKVTSSQEALDTHYKNQVDLATIDAFEGFSPESGLRSASVEDLARQFNTLDEAGQQMFFNALAGINEINKAAKEAGYYNKEVAVDTREVLEMAQSSITTVAATDVIGDISAKVSGIQAKFEAWDNAPAEETAAAIESVNEALSALGIDDFQVESIDQIGEAVKKINELDPSKLELDPAKIQAVADAFGKLGGDAETAKQKLTEAKQKADALAGTYDVVVNYKENGKLPDAPGNANGGIYDGAFLSWVAEDGPEAIIPLGAKRRSRGIDLWLQAGRALGVTEFADGGIVAPYADMFEGLPDSFFDSGEEGGTSAPPPMHIGTSGGGGITIYVDVDADPEFTIDGSLSPDEIIAIVRQHSRELAEVFGDEIAAQLEDIASNMV